jgi:hypothetical protein
MILDYLPFGTRFLSRLVLRTYGVSRFPFAHDCIDTRLSLFLGKKKPSESKFFLIQKKKKKKKKTPIKQKKKKKKKKFFLKKKKKKKKKKKTLFLYIVDHKRIQTALVRTFGPSTLRTETIRKLHPPGAYRVTIPSFHAITNFCRYVQIEHGVQDSTTNISSRREPPKPKLQIDDIAQGSV